MYYPKRRSRLSLRAVVFATVVYVLYLIAAGIIGWDRAHSHDWFPSQCCNGGDCDVITADQVQTTRQGFVFPGNPEVVPYSSPKIKQTPPEGDGAYAICTKGGVKSAPIICLYIPTWGS